MSNVLLLFLGCSDSIGTPCVHTQGSFGLKDPCTTMCLDLQSVICPDGSYVKPAVCAGTAPCTPGSCASGEVCHAFNDPFEGDSHCIPDDVCGASPTDAERAAWEKASFAHWEATKAKYEKRKPSLKVAPSAP